MSFPLRFLISFSFQKRRTHVSLRCNPVLSNRAYVERDGRGVPACRVLASEYAGAAGHERLRSGFIGSTVQRDDPGPVHQHAVFTRHDQWPARAVGAAGRGWGDRCIPWVGRQRAGPPGGRVCPRHEGAAKRLRGDVASGRQSTRRSQCLTRAGDGGVRLRLLGHFGQDARWRLRAVRRRPVRRRDGLQRSADADRSLRRSSYWNIARSLRRLRGGGRNQTAHRISVICQQKNGRHPGAARAVCGRNPGSTLILAGAT